MTTTRAKKKRKPRYESPLRKAQADDTTRRIVEGAYVALQSVRPENLSYADLAVQTGIAQRTIYRHFPDRGDLVTAVARLHLEKFLGPTLKPADDLPGFAVQLAALHRLLSTDRGAYRVMMAAPTRGEAGAGAYVARMAKDVVDRAPPADRATILGVWELCVSPFFWEVLHTHHGVAPERITRAATVMLDLLEKALAKDPHLFDPARPPPKRFAPTTRGEAP